MPSKSAELVCVPFYDDTIDAVKGEDGVIKVAIKRICENLGVAQQRQLEKLKSYHWACVTMMVTHDSSGREQELSFLDLESLPLWLVTIHPSKVAEHIRPKLVIYQKEAKAVLARHFLGPIAAVPATVAADSPPHANAELMRALVEMVAAQSEMLAEVVKWMRALERRLAVTESQLADVQSQFVEVESRHDEFDSKVVAAASTAIKALRLADDDDDVRYLTLFGTPNSRSSGSPTGRSTSPAFACRTTAAGTRSDTKRGSKGRGAR